ncbi:MAG: cob(I)yrinic acid a,c-diamide adenosyltransferase [Candidatus Omnitrophica bacterium]|nr:cob(I)yrinic acid a,c-diamide adenosyltransferase [Candidatus Omnitrophota bacterium]
MKGYIQVYTGDGKGKTTAALGLVMRALGAGLRVYIGQFMKKGSYSEFKFLSDLKKNIKEYDIKIEQFGAKRFIGRKPAADDKQAAIKGFKRIKEVIDKGKYDLIILDEINVVLHYKLLPIEEVVSVLKDKPAALELILTGRYAPAKIIKAADLVTEMKQQKHYYKKIRARQGIEK